MLGSVKWFNDAKGYGFIIAGVESYFVHFKEILGEPGFKTLKPGDEVEFTPSKSEKGLVAKNVRLVNHISDEQD